MKIRIHNLCRAYLVKIDMSQLNALILFSLNCDTIIRLRLALYAQ